MSRSAPTSKPRRASVRSGERLRRATVPRAIRLWQLLRCAYLNFCFDDCVMLATAMSFLGVLSLIPLALVGISALGYALGSSHEARELVRSLVAQDFPRTANEIMREVDRIVTSPSRHVTEGVGLVGLFWAGSRLFETLERVLTHVFAKENARSFFGRKIFTMFVFLAAGVFFGASLLITTLLQAATRFHWQLYGHPVSLWIHALEKLVPWLITVAMFFLLYKFLPNCKVDTRKALVSALGAGFFWEMFKRLFARFIAGSPSYGQIYGSLSGGVLLMFWIYISTVVLLFGAEFAAAWQGRACDYDKAE